MCTWHLIILKTAIDASSTKSKTKSKTLRMDPSSYITLGLLLRDSSQLLADRSINHSCMAGP